MNGILMMAVLGLTALWQMHHVQNHNNNQQHTIAQQAAEHRQLHMLATQLLQFSAQQGYNSHSHLGHLPCPATSPAGPARVACNQATLRYGYLPWAAQSGINYHNPALPAMHSITESSIAKHWHYAVSPQLVQPNTLNWSRWVNFAATPMRLQLPDGQHTVAAAVVAKALLPIGADHYRVTAPFIVVPLAQLQAYVQRTQVHQVHHHLSLWLKQHKQPSLGNNTLPNLTAAGTDWIPSDSGCACQCTRTRCECMCTQKEATWVSSSPCITMAPQCGPIAPHTLAQRTQPITGLITECKSSPLSPCTFRGTASLASAWPISRFEPTPAANRSCRPSQMHICPLSPNNTPCRCEFSWPETSKTHLQYLRIANSSEEHLLHGMNIQMHIPNADAHSTQSGQTP